MELFPENYTQKKRGRRKPGRILDINLWEKEVEHLPDNDCISKSVEARLIQAGCGGGRGGGGRTTGSVMKLPTASNGAGARGQAEAKLAGKEAK